MKRIALYIVFVPLFLTINGPAMGQTIGSSIPPKIDVHGRYLFYLHGAVVTELGDNAINQSVPEWGPYEYSNILDSLEKQGFYVISEIRRKGIGDPVYVHKIVNQIDSLLAAGVKTENLLVIGASAGSNITLGVSSALKNENLRYVIMGGCWPESYKDYLHTDLYGHFLSIIEASDPHGSCYMIFKKRDHVTSYREVVLHTGLSHGFIYKGRREWIGPIMKWFDNPDNKK